jgi:2-keto-4-pentenoate hydratase/2-oxohepta-3-ene-1,7-dioic acid hydratase in catechol pathway
MNNPFTHVTTWIIAGLIATALFAGADIPALGSKVEASQQVTKYVRYSYEGSKSYGVLEGTTVYELDGDIFASPSRSGRSMPLANLRLLAPVEPSKVIAVGLNYGSHIEEGRSHIGDSPVAEYPGLFAKFPTSIIGPDAEIVIPSDAGDVHYEGELVVVIGSTTKNVPIEDAADHIFGVTAGNDVSERAWQGADLQWVRAKGSDTFGPIGPAIVTGLDYNDLLVETRLNGETRQSASSEDLIFGVDYIVSYISRYVTLYPGDVIFTGTPGSTRAMTPGDVVEIEVQGVGVLRNTVAAAH